MEPVAKVETCTDLLTQFYEKFLDDHFIHVHSQMGLQPFLKEEPSETPEDEHEMNGVQVDLNNVKIEPVDQVQQVASSVISQMSLKVEPVDHSEFSSDIKTEENDPLYFDVKQEPLNNFNLAPNDQEVSATCYPCFTCKYNPHNYPTRLQKRLEHVHQTCDPVLQ